MSFTRFIASQLGNPHGWFGRAVMTRLLNRGNTELIVATLDLLGIRAGDRVSDIGFGGGRGLELAAKRIGPSHLTGIDPSADAVAHTRRRLAHLIDLGKLDLIHMGVVGIADHPGRYDRILSTNTIYFWSDLEHAFDALAGVLAPGGRVCLGFAGIEKIRQFSLISRHGFRLHDEHEVAKIARARGLSNIELLPQRGRRISGDFVLRASRPEPSTPVVGH